MKGAKTGLFIVELMISLLMFSFCAAVCIQLFLAARVRTDRAQDISMAVNVATSAAEAFKASPGEDFESWQIVFPGGAETVDAYGVNGARVLFDADWEPADSEGEAEYVLIGHITGDRSAKIGVYYYDESKPGDSIFEITVRAVSTFER